MTKIENLLCRASLHAWSLWEITEVPLITIGDSDVIKDTSNLRIEAHTRHCTRCNKEETRKVFCW